MKSKLTLSIPQQAVRKGKRIASLRKQSLSDLVTRYLEGLEVEPEATGIDPGLADCLGVYKLPAGKNVDDLLLQSLLQKHGGKA